ncbi:MAG: hypothetical protein K6G72_07270 [Lachnospiraceae bacterium]|nr:hypothetical protein [Lachnospiraceae bacterium]
MSFFDYIRAFIVGGVLLVIAFGIPVVLSVFNILCLFIAKIPAKIRRTVWILTIVFGIMLSFVYASVIMEIENKEWNLPIYMGYHQPVWTEGQGFYVAICLLSLVGFVILELRPASKTPPLVTVLCMAPQYLMIVTLVVWCIQIKDINSPLPLMVLPINIVVMILTLIRQKIAEWNASVEHDEALDGKNAFFRTLNRWMAKASLWPVFAFVAVIPLLGIMLLILTLFGQQPDIIVKAWTETADYAFSQRIPPEVLPYDGHYLCTVAARGHKGLVRPLRYGERNGTVVTVNRQLEIANAFEQVLEERTPRLHRLIRNFYDKHGLPIAKVIRTKFSSDLVYILMKPLEWIFLVVLYLTDSNPENRIHVQYLPGYRDFLKEK